MKNIVYSILCLPLILIASCSSEVVSCSHRNTPEQGWAMSDTILLSVQVTDTTEVYDLAVTLRHTELYPYQNLWLFVQGIDSLSPLPADTVMACLADDRGRWLARRAGRYYTGFVTMERHIEFAHPGTYTFAIVQAMRDSLINGIADIGLELRKNHGQE